MPGSVLMTKEEAKEGTEEEDRVMAEEEAKNKVKEGTEKEAKENVGVMAEEEAKEEAEKKVKDGSIYLPRTQTTGEPPHQPLRRPGRRP